jgi:hypothetical protein
MRKCRSVPCLTSIAPGHPGHALTAPSALTTLTAPSTVRGNNALSGEPIRRCVSTHAIGTMGMSMGTQEIAPYLFSMNVVQYESCFLHDMNNPNSKDFAACVISPVLADEYDAHTEADLKIIERSGSDDEDAKEAKEAKEAKGAKWAKWAKLTA